MVLVNKTLALAMVAVLGGCDVYEGDGDPAPDAGVVGSLDGGWSFSANLNPCRPTPAPVAVAFDVSGSDLAPRATSIMGSTISSVDFDRYSETTGSVVIATDDAAAWVLEMNDDGVTATLSYVWTSASGCTVRADVEPVRER